MATARKTTRRPYGAGSLYSRGGVWYAHWRADGGRQVKRRIGPMRVEGSRDGLTRSQAEAELRRLIAETKPARITAGDALTMAELGRRLPREPGASEPQEGDDDGCGVDPARLA
jgi:hypothetical protein